uniref:FMRFamide-like neuropeptide PF1 n=1 Tax=Panagrellus redivivus TaxID=6233 RepID=FAR1_PANRE|nr:RecName: Full=FMRFamide-like neuropeptide PF1; AltName: Full=SDPNFLRF-amide [Panagrellus redivivus]
SDPNFLRF